MKHNPHPEPLNQDVRQFVETLDIDAREYFEERAGIAEFEAGMSRADAERFAMELMRAETVIYQSITIRRIALGKKNWLFAGSEQADQRAAAIQTLLVTAKLNGIDPAEWPEIPWKNCLLGLTALSMRYRRLHC
jgi:hypothetical protein